MVRKDVSSLEGTKKKSSSLINHNHNLKENSFTFSLTVEHFCSFIVEHFCWLTVEHSSSCSVEHCFSLTLRHWFEHSGSRKHCPRSVLDCSRRQFLSGDEKGYGIETTWWIAKQTNKNCGTIIFKRLKSGKWQRFLFVKKILLHDFYLVMQLLQL